MVQQPSYWKVLTRRKVLPAEGVESEGKLNRVLGIYDLTALGVGSTLGAGVYVLAGQIAKEQAGPSVMLSFAIAALASLLAGVCYAEFGARVPKAGSAYIYSYVCIGEFAAFIIGWNLILEYIIGTASVCRGISLYLDTLLNDTLKHTFEQVAPMNVSFLGSYFDFFACGLVIVFGVALAFGVEASTWANNFCTCVNICILLFVVIAGSIKADFSNWTINPANVNATDTDIGAGGYFPFGFQGTLKSAATCFFGFVGFDCIATTGEEVRNPRKNIPRSILLSLLIIFLCYFGVSTVLTLMVPYYLEDLNAPIPYAFQKVGWNFAMWIVSIGGLIGLLASLFGALFPLPRIMYSMAEDGLLFKFLGKVNLRYRVPVVGSIFAAMLTALMAGLFDLAQLVNLLSIGTLLAYSVVAISVTILRYMDNSDSCTRETCSQPPSENSLLTSTGFRITFKSVMIQLFNIKRVHTPNALSTRIVGSLISIFCLLSLGIGLILMEAYDALIHNQLWVLILLGFLTILAALVLLAIYLQPRETYTSLFRVPFVPLVPAISIFINIFLMLQLDVMTWIRFFIWMGIGTPMFIACWCMYDIKNPAKHNPNRIAFAKALKNSSRINCKEINGYLNDAYTESNSTADVSTKSGNKTPENIGENGTIFTIHGHSTNSLDEIVNINDMGDDLIEMKYPNGKIFFIEDSKSNTSTTTIDKYDESHPNEIADIVEDEKSVIALLDDVLQAEDDSSLPLTNLQEYSRKISVDSELLPSVIETTTVATVHSSSDSSSKDLTDLSELDQENSISSSSSSLSDIFDLYKETQRVASGLVDEILSATKLYDAVQKREGTNRDQLKRSNSATSIRSTDNIENPLRSDFFKQKLSQIILRSTTSAIQKPVNKSNDIDEKQKTESDEIIKEPKLKYSISEPDVQQLLPSNINTDEEYVDTTDNIPKPPKFDPVLYNTINSLSKGKERPALAKLLKQDEEYKPKTKANDAKSLSSSQQLPFKEKLEAILMRGPSHHTQKVNEHRLLRPKSIGPTPNIIISSDLNETNRELKN